VKSCNPLLKLVYVEWQAGDPNGIRTRVNAVKGVSVGREPSTGHHEVWIGRSVIPTAIHRLGLETECRLGASYDINLC
jgi:hypothetical protein